MRKLLLILPLLFALGCKAPAPDGPQVPKPPQLRVLEYVQLGAQSTNTAAHTLRVLCAPDGPTKPALDAETCSNAAVHVRTAARTFDKLAGEAASADPWPTMRVKLAGIASAATIASVVPNQALQQQLDAIQIIVMQILGVR